MVGFWQNGFLADFYFWAAGFCRRIFSPHFCGKKCPEKSSRKIPDKILQILYNKNPRQFSAEGPGQNLRRRSCVGSPPPPSRDPSAVNRWFVQSTGAWFVLQGPLFPIRCHRLPWQALGSPYRALSNCLSVDHGPRVLIAQVHGAPLSIGRPVCRTKLTRKVYFQNEKWSEKRPENSPKKFKPCSAV